MISNKFINASYNSFNTNKHADFMHFKPKKTITKF